MRKPHIAVIGHSVGAELYGAERSLLSLLAAIDRSRYDLSCVLPGTNDDYLRAVLKHTENVTISHISGGRKHGRSIRRPPRNLKPSFKAGKSISSM